MNCTDAYREALTRDFQSSTAPAPAPPPKSGAATAPGTGQDDISSER
jgi:hypothetical protein